MPSSKPAKLSRADRKALRAGKREKRRETFRNLRQAFTLTRQADPRFVPALVIAGVVALAVVYVVAYVISGSPYYPIPLAIIAALVAAMLVFSRRAQKSMYSQAEGQAGAAGWM
ncbi:MAG TPA: DUF4191 family protein, partial [Jatrophihabitans sp.]|nr:DUF4191 family protein [Jatrophihabitans sp.]